MILKYVFIFSFSFFILGCNDSKRELFNEKGGGYYAVNGINFVHFDSGNIEIIQEMPGNLIKNIDSVREGELLLSSYKLTSNSIRNEISIYDLKRKENNFLFHGSAAQYFSGKIIYYDLNRNLVIYNYDSDKKSIILDMPESSKGYKITAISNNEFIFYKYKKGFYKYNVKSNFESKVNELNNCSYTQIIRVNDNVICDEKIDGKYTGKYLLINLDGKVIDEINFNDREITIVKYIFDLDVVLFLESTGSFFYKGRFFSERTELFAYSLTDRTEKLISDNAFAKNLVYSKDLILSN